MCNKIKSVLDAIAMQESARLLQHLFHFIAHKSTPFTDETNGLMRPKLSLGTISKWPDIEAPTDDVCRALCGPSPLCAGRGPATIMFSLNFV